MAKKQSRRTRIEGDVSVTNGDVVAGDKTVIQDGDNNISPPEFSSRSKRKKTMQGRNFKGNLDVSGGDVIFGDKIIEFIQKRLNVYLFKDIKQLAFFLAVFIIVIGGFAGGTWYSNQPKKMTGNFNIAVAQFGEIQEDGSVGPSANAEKISSTLFNFLDSEYRASGLGLSVQFAHKNMPLIIEQAQAEDLARRINADMVIFGNVSISAQGDSAEFSPRFYVAEQADTKELTGQNELAYPIPFRISDLGSENEIHAKLRTQTEILFNFTKGLIYFSEEDFELASRSLQVAVTAAEGLSKPFAGEEALYLLSARIQMSQGNDEDANTFLDQALVLNPNYARAFLARGNIFYTQAVKANFDAELLEKAQYEFTRAYEAPNQPEGAYIPIKAHTSLGNVLVVRAQQTNNPDLFSQAIANYLYVTDEYKRTNDPFVRGYAAVAYFGLGAAYERQGQKSEAIKCYEQAYDLTEDKEFQARIEEQINAVQSD